MNCFKTQWAWSLRPRNQRGECFRRRERTSFPLGMHAPFFLTLFSAWYIPTQWAQTSLFVPSMGKRGWWCKGWRAFTWPRGKWKSLSCVRPFATPWSIQPMEFSRSEYWSGQPFPSPGDLPNPEIDPRSPTLQAVSLPAELQGKPKNREWVAYPFSSGASRLRNRTGVSWIAGRFFTSWAVSEAQIDSMDQVNKSGVSDTER